MQTTDYNSRLSGLRKRYDVIIVGGGIYGAALCWEAASRGLRSILLEKNDFGSGTSANSLKVIHGGIRYLQQWDIKRIRQSSRERTALMCIAPHLVYPLHCVMPTYRGLRRGRLALRAGMTLYDVLTRQRNANVDPTKQIARGKTISLPELKSLVPNLSWSDITGGALWYDAQVYNSERLVLAFIKSATNQGAHAYNYVKATDYIARNHAIQGVVAKDAFSGAEHRVMGDIVVDCTGPWVSRNDPLEGQLAVNEKMRFVRAVNLVVPRAVASCAVGVKAPANGDSEHGGRRLLFVVPWREGSIFGTWYFKHSGQPEKARISTSELDRCVAEINAAFPGMDLKRQEISLMHLGLLPSDVRCGSFSEPNLQTKSSVIDAARMGGQEGVFLVQGVKYTTARNIAVHTVDRICKSINKPLKSSNTNVTPLYGGSISDFRAFYRRCLEQYASRSSPQIVSRLVANYGSNIDHIFAYVDGDARLSELVPGTVDAIRAELNFVLDNEMVHTLSDLLLRRTDIGSFAMPADETIEYCADLLAERQGWDHATKRTNKEALISRYPEWCRN